MAAAAERGKIPETAIVLPEAGETGTIPGTVPRIGIGIIVIEITGTGTGTEIVPGAEEEEGAIGIVRGITIGGGIAVEGGDMSVTAGVIGTMTATGIEMEVEAVVAEGGIGIGVSGTWTWHRWQRRKKHR